MNRRPLSSILIAAAALAGLGTALPAAAAQFAKPEDAISTAKGAFTVMAAHFGRVAGMAQGKIPSMPRPRRATPRSRPSCPRCPSPMASARAPTRAARRAPARDLGRDGQVQRRREEKMQDRMAKLNAAARRQPWIHQRWRQATSTQVTCKACHDDYRKAVGGPGALKARARTLRCPRCRR